MVDNKSSNLDSLLGFEVDVKLVLKHLRNDFSDEWFYDCLHYDDLLKNNSNVHETLKSIVGEGLGSYSPEARVIRDVPKKGLPIRYSLETGFYDRFVYQAICSFLIPFFDPLLSHRVLSNRFGKRHRSNSRQRYLFKSPIESWLTYEGVTYTFKRDKKFLLVTDLANYFENIRSKDIISAFEHLFPRVSASPSQMKQIRSALTLLDSCLKKWSFNDGYGLAQNRDSSHFLANIVLSSIDRKMETLGYDYYRYVDDIRIICDSDNQAKKALHVLIGQLRNTGLNINSSKTRVLSEKSKTEDIAADFPNKDARVVAIEQMWKSKSKNIVLKSVKYLILLIEECIKNDETQSRPFRFSANRLAQLAGNDVLSQAQLGAGLPNLLVEGMLEQPASTDQYCKILNVFGLDKSCSKEIEAFLVDRSKAIHDWQNYHLWMLLARKKIKTQTLRKNAISILKTNMNSAEAGGILIWADQVGYKSVVNTALSHFEKDAPFQIQRYLAIVTRDWPDAKMEELYPKISSRIRGTKDRAKQYENAQGKIELPNRKVEFRDLYSEISEYD